MLYTVDMEKRSVIGVVLNEQRDEVLILKRRDTPIWVLPGGGVDPGEDLETAVVREVLEETGVKVAIRRKVGEYYPINRLTRTTHVFECDQIEGEPKVGEESLEVAFYHVEKLPKDFFHIHQEMIQDTLKNLPEPFKKPLNGVTYLNVFKYFLRHPIRVIRFTLSQMGLPLNR